MKQRKYIQAILLLAVVLAAGCGKKAAEPGEREKGIAFLEEQDYESAIDAFDHALDEKKLKKETERDIKLYKASAQCKLEQQEAAIKTYSEISDFETDGEAQFLQGTVYLQIDEKEKALANFQKAVEHDDKNYELYQDIYLSLENSGYGAEGQVYLEKIVQQVTGDKEVACLRRGKAYYYLEDYKNAKKELTAAKEKGSSYAVMYLGLVEEKQGEYEKAVEIYKEYLEDNKEDAEMYNRIAKCKLELGDDSALSFIEAGLELADEGENQELLYHQIVAYEKQLDFQTAREKAEAYLRLYPDDEQVKREYEFLKTRS